ncbi:hypothetical protein [Cryptosporangium sp. NPDC051539]|uniref:hypothetical protein n=1 Tax=Cryptosporangium sp. NPDC051539 TaxID=3363962 RepID=UPI00379FED46
MTELTRARPLPRRLAATGLAGSVVGAAAALRAGPSVAVVLGLCAAVVIYLDSSVARLAAARLRTGVLIGLGIGLVNGVGAALSLGPAAGAALGAETVIGTGLSVGAAWGLAGLVLRIGPGSRTIGLALTLAGPCEALTREGCDGELHGLTGRRERFGYALGVLCGALVIRTRRIGASVGRTLDWFLAADLRLLGVAATPVLVGAVVVYLQESSFRAVFDSAQNLATVGGVVLFAGECLRELRHVRPRRLGRKTPSKH